MLRSFLLVLILLVCGVSLVLADEPEIPTYKLDVVEGQLVLTTSAMTGPSELNMCVYIESSPGYDCGKFDVTWDVTKLVLSDATYFVGDGIGPNYEVQEEATDYGWQVTQGSDGFVKVDVHTFALRDDLYPILYEYRGSAWGGLFPKGVNYCRFLGGKPYFECGFDPNPEWVLRNGVWSLTLEPGTYFVGSGGEPVHYLINPDFQSGGGWDLSPNLDGFLWNPYTSYVPTISR